MRNRARPRKSTLLSMFAREQTKVVQRPRYLPWREMAVDFHRLNHTPASSLRLRRRPRPPKVQSKNNRGARRTDPPREGGQPESQARAHSDRLEPVLQWFIAGLVPNIDVLLAEGRRERRMTRRGDFDLAGIGSGLVSFNASLKGATAAVLLPETRNPHSSVGDKTCLSKFASPELGKPNDSLPGLDLGPKPIHQPRRFGVVRVNGVESRHSGLIRIDGAVVKDRRIDQGLAGEIAVGVG
jgi:hypothetical protein